MYDWAEKALAQQSDWAEQFDLARQLRSIGLLTNEIRHAGSSHGGELKRKKRFHSTDERLLYVQKLDMKCAALRAAGVKNAAADRKQLETTKEPENGFWCSPFFLTLNPMMIFSCRVAGHHNLHFL